MAWLPISGTLPQYSTANNGLAADYYIKFYASGTTTPINMATDSTGGTTLAKCALSADGYPISNPLDDSTRFIPHIDQDYRIVMYMNETDADNNTTASAVFNIDGMVLQVVPTGDAANITLRDVTIEEQDDYDRSPLFIDGTDFTAGAGPHVITVPADWTPTDADMRFYRLDNSGIVTALTPSSTSSTTFTLAETLLSTDIIFIGDDDFRGFRLATEDYTGGVEKATVAEMNSGVSGKFPDAATIATRTATETRTGLVEKATDAEMSAGTADKYPDCETIKNDRASTVVWSGADTSISPAAILASSGHVVTAGHYYLRTFGSSDVIYVVTIPTSASDNVAGSSYPTTSFLRFGSYNLVSTGNFEISQNSYGGSAAAVTIQEIRYSPL